MAETILIFDLDGNEVYDPEGAIDGATEITWSSAWPKGYMEASFKVRRADVFASWVIKESYGVIIYDDATIVYQGRIESMPRNAGGLDEYVTVQCTGWYVVLEERTVRKRWVDIKAISYLRWPDNLRLNAIQNTWVSNRRDNMMQVFVGTGDVGRTNKDKYQELYELPAGAVRKVSFTWIGRTGEFIDLRILNETANADELTVSVSSPTPVSHDESVTFALADTGSFRLIWEIKVSDTYDQNDFIHVSNLKVWAKYETGHRTTTPTYTQGQLVEDVILLVNQKGAQLSTDFSQLGDPGQILDPFVIEEPEYAGPVIDKILAYGDSLLQTWGLLVWDQSDTSDGKPRVVLEARSVDNWEYEVTLSSQELQALTYEKISSELYNNVDVQYINEREETRYRSAADNPALADAASIAAEYQRDKFLKLGVGDATRADYVGSRGIEYHKDRLTRATIAIQGFVTLKGGGQVPASRVRAGRRIKLMNTDEVFFIRHTSYDAETKTVRISPDMPVDNISMLFVQRERGMGRLSDGK